MTITTWLTEKCGVEVPIVQGGTYILYPAEGRSVLKPKINIDPLLGMQWVGRAVLVAPIANSGALGFITALTQPSPEALRQEIRKCRELTSKPFGVNITMLPAMKMPDYLGYAKVAVEEGIRVIETAGDPSPILGYLKQNGVIVIHKCVVLKHALRAEKMGVDCVSIDGIECAGHGGEYDLSSLILLSKCAEELKIPYIASGGFANGQGLAAALSLGAAGCVYQNIGRMNLEC